MTLTTADIQEVLAQVTYRPGWSLTCFQHEHEGTHILIRAEVPDSYHPNQTTELRIYSPLPPMPDADALLAWLGWRLQLIEVHESHEWLRHGGLVVSDPHRETPAMLAALAQARGATPLESVA